MTIEAQRAEHHRDRLIKIVTDAIGPPYDGVAALQNIAFASRLVTALLALHVLHAHADTPSRSTEQDQPKKKDPVS